MRATSAFVRLLIRGLAWDAEDAGASFDDTLKTAARARLTDTQKGKVLVGTTSGGTSVTFALPPLDDLTGKDVMEACSFLLDKSVELRASTPDLSDEALVAALLDAIKPVRAVASDFRSYRA